MKILNLAGVSELLLYGEIGPWTENPASEVVSRVQAVTASTIVLRVNSPGGDAFDATAIMNALRHHPARVVVVVEGLAASAASLIAVGAADELIMAPSSELMIHNAWCSALGDAMELGEVAARLEAESRRIAEVYAGKAGGEVDTWLQLMAAETWFTAEEAVEAGLADRVGLYRDTDSDSDLAVAACASSRIMAKYRYSSRAEAPSPGLFSCPQEGTHMSVLDKIAHRLGLKADEPEERVLAALDEVLAVKAPAEDAPVVDEDPVEEPVEPTTPEDEAVAPEEEPEPTEEAEEEPEESPDDLITVTRGDWEDLHALAQEGLDARAAQRQREAVEFAQNAVDEGRIGAARKGAWVNRWLDDPARAESDMAAIPKNLIPRVEVGHGADSDSPGVDVRSAIRRSGINLSPSV